MLIIIILLLLSNTILWKLSNEPYNIRVHFFFLFYYFSTFNNFEEWCEDKNNIISEFLFERHFYYHLYIKRIIIEDKFKEIQENCVYDIKIRKRNGYKIYLYSCSNTKFDVVDLEIKLIDYLKEKVDIIFINKQL